MDGEKKQNQSRASLRRDADNDPGRIHEYDFFLTRDGETAGKSAGAEEDKRSEAGEGKRNGNNSIAFFLPE